MSWAQSQAVLNDGFMAVYGGDAVVVASGETITAAFDRPHDDADRFGVPVSRPQPELLIYDDDAPKLPNASLVRANGVDYTVVDAQGSHDGLTRLTVRAYASV